MSSLTKNTLLYGAATLIERIISFLILPLLTKNLPQEVYGVWTQIIITSGLLSMVAMCGFQTGIVRFLSGAKENAELSKVFHGTLGIVLLNSVLIVAATFLFTPQLNGLVFNDIRFSAFVPLLGFFIVSESLFELVAAFLRARGAILPLSIYYIIKNVTRIASLALGIFVFRADLYQSVVFIILFQTALTIVIYVKDILKKIGFQYSLSKTPWKNILTFSLPLAPYAILIWANNFVNRYFILHILDMKQLSVYAVAYSLAGIAGLFYSIPGYTMYPHMAKQWNDAEMPAAAETLAKAITYYLFFAVPFIAVITIFSRPIIEIFSTSGYITNWQVIFWLSAGIVIFGLYQINNYGILLADKTFFNLLLSAVALLGNIILNIVLVPSWGILGASIATFLSNGILAVWTMNVNKKILPYIFPWTVIAKILFATAAMSIIILIVKHHIAISGLPMLIFFIAAACGIYAAIDLLNKDSILIKFKRALS